MAAANALGCCWLEAASVRVAQQSLGWAGEDGGGRPRQRSSAFVRACSGRPAREVAVQRVHDLNLHLCMTTPTGSGPLSVGS